MGRLLSKAWVANGDPDGAVYLSTCPSKEVRLIAVCFRLQNIFFLKIRKKNGHGKLKFRKMA